jgi:putative nucleotidyltransferase with HDIG domain
MMKTASDAKAHTTAQQLSQLEYHLMTDDAPSAYLKEQSAAGALDGHPFSMLKKLRDTPQSPVHHPEGSVWNHTLLVVDEAAKHKSASRDPRAFMWAALLHDIGKPATTRKRGDKITAYNHETVGAKLSEEFLRGWSEDARFLDKVTQLVKYHMQLLYVNKHLPFMDLAGMKKHTDIREIALLGLCDRLGRKGADPAAEEEQVALFLRLCNVPEKRKETTWQRQA